MSEQPSSVTFRVPDVKYDGVIYTNIEENSGTSSQMIKWRIFAKCSISIACIALSVLFGCGEESDKKIAKDEEQIRVTSPNGQLDAILLREDGGGAAGGWEWYVYIVSKGSYVIPKNDSPIFNAGTLTNGRILWTQEHLVEINYDIAQINQFRNLWGLNEIQNVGAAGEHNYLVEIRLNSTSQSFSLLTADGKFKPKN
jgi:hypothetical protein